MIRSSNPLLKPGTFAQASDSQSGVMTIKGTVRKTAILIGILLFTGSWTWSQALSGGANAVTGLAMIGGIGAFILALITVFKKEKAPITAPLYAGFEGLLLGGLSAVMEVTYPGIVIQAVGLTIATLLCLLGAYQSGWIKPTENFKLGLFAATGGIAVVYIAGFIFSLFGVNFGIFSSSPIGIAFSFIVVGIAALNLVMDFDFIEEGAARQAPGYMEWYAAFGLLVTLVWLYIEILRLLAKLRSRD